MDDDVMDWQTLAFPDRGGYAAHSHYGGRVTGVRDQGRALVGGEFVPEVVVHTPDQPTRHADNRRTLDLRSL
jgi:hypothetical protein